MRNLCLKVTAPIFIVKFAGPWNKIGSSIIPVSLRFFIANVVGLQFSKLLSIESLLELAHLGLASFQIHLRC